MKVVIFSDLHSYSFKPYSTVLEDGVNSRLRHATACIDAVLEHAVSIDADLVLFGGDLFHERKHISTQAFNETVTALSKFAIEKIPLAMIPGNHDQADKLGKFHSLQTLNMFATVLDEPGWTTIAGREGEYQLLAVPYIEDYNHLEDVIQSKNTVSEGLPSLFLGHFGVHGARIGADFVYNNASEPSIGQLPLDKVDAAFLGHFHMHQQLASNCWYVGAPLQHNWGDSGQVRGFMEYDTETKQAKHIPIHEVPKFVTLQIGEEWNTSHGDYLRVISDKPWSEDQIESTRVELGARSLEIVPSKIHVDEAYETRLDLEPGASYEEMVAEYVKSPLVELDGLDEDSLISIAREVLTEVG